MDWDGDLQPPCRRCNATSFPPPRVVPDDPDEWLHICKKGPSGIYLLVITLVWWFVAVKKMPDSTREAEMARVLLAVNDLEWSLGVMVTSAKSFERGPTPPPTPPPTSASTSHRSTRKRQAVADLTPQSGAKKSKTVAKGKKSSRE